ncbi:LysR family transcriptional regulator [Bordetella pertussis]|uniref:LysR family transcriptional regulator n=1 Tax=Bordetella pertussis TaxID=520 RepID=UPI00097CE96F|nr:LysR family transcriptional regulator [Bordetella pertussis]AQH90279.1 GntR family transcriptional regulator [Bordetella pertussis]AQJ58747.1 GntR family transcriptional regulator [Bordetella pertussis]AZX48613.1 LysR family transcriptional regulator [Bordetella pertussis]QBW52367.1 LysR family transcriptional regulator [Bordetella pertussis]QBW59552.1 LysR family transcriptional regulator [Bordetella pertussis]
MNPARFDLVTLALFVAVARQGSISAGARQSHLAVGAASKRISDLESALGTPLLYRTAAGVELTDAGQACLAHAVRVLQEVEHMAGVLSDFAQGVRGQVRIAAGLTTVPYRLDELVLITPPRHPLAARAQVAFADTLDCDYVGLPPATSLATRLADESARLDKRIRLRIQVRSFDAICRMVVATGGVGILPRIAAEPHARSMQVRLIPLADDWAQRWLLLGVRDLDSLPVAARLLVRSLAEGAA